MKYFKAKRRTSKLLHAQLTLTKQKPGEHQIVKNHENVNLRCVFDEMNF